MMRNGGDGTPVPPAGRGGPDRTLLRRAPLGAAQLRTAVIRPGGLWREVEVVPETGSTNADLLAAAAAGAGEGIVRAAEAQTAGRGRLGRRWVSPPRAALTFSVLLRPDAVPPARRGWLPLLAGVALAMSLRASAAIAVELKWPNDVLAGGAKLAGILAEQSGDPAGGAAVVVGAGVNVSASRDELPVPGATSLALSGAACLDRNQLLVAMLSELERWYRAWSRCAGNAEAAGLRAQYRQLCATLGRQVRVQLPGGRTLAGQADDVDTAGRLVVATGSGLVPVSAGDVIHVR